MKSDSDISYPTIKQSWGIIGISVLALVVFTPAMILLTPLTGKELAVLIYYLLAMGTSFWFAHYNRHKWTHTSAYNLELASAKIIVLACIGVVAIQVGVITPIVSLIPMPEFTKKMFIEFGSRKGIFSAIAIIIAAPILEELVFRGIILDGFLKRYSPAKSILTSSMLFGFIHLNPWQFITAFIIGIFSGWVYYKTRKLTASIAIHFVNNSAAFTAIYFSNVESYIDKSILEIYGGLTTMIALILGAIIVTITCIYLLQREFKAADLNHDRTQGYNTILP